MSYDASLIYLDEAFSLAAHKNSTICGRCSEGYHRLTWNWTLRSASCSGRRYNTWVHLFTVRGTTDPEKLEAVNSWPRPIDKHQLRSFLGLCTHYRRLADIVKPLTRLAKQKQTCQWYPQAQNTFNSLKEALYTAPFPGLPATRGEVHRRHWCQQVGIGGVLSQVQDGSKRVVAHFSKPLSKAERNYCVTRRELLAIVKTLEYFHKQLHGHEFHLTTDHSILTCLLNFRNLKEQMARWVQHLHEYNITSEHCQDLKHTNAENLSRQSWPDEWSQCQKDEQQAQARVRKVAAAAANSWDRQALRREQLEDDAGPLLQEMEAG